MIVKNNGVGLINALSLTQGTLKHIGNFVFTAEVNGAPVKIYTAPADEDFENLTIINVVAG